MARRDDEKWFLHVGADLHRLIREAAPATSGRYWEPKVDVFESERAFVVKVELAGIDSDDIKVVYVPDRHTLLIKGHRRESDLDTDELTGCHLLEIFYGPFEREVPLPNFPVKGESIKAEYQNGILVVCVPKASITKRKITLNIRKV